ncbi:Protein of unknown function DUF1685 [Dillenia turbinata]|uniref:Uncharacterized protein n=1 Tax=Dillenia turbinata TaxID=194707 RepID=A0AAN8UIE8_9MAGN
MGFSCDSETRAYSDENPSMTHALEYPEETPDFHYQPDPNPLFSQFEKQRLKTKKLQKSKSEEKRSKIHVCLEGYVEAEDPESKTMARTKSLTDEDLDELKGCLDLGFGFSYEEIPELCNTLPALELCYSMSQKFLDDQQKSPPETLPDSCSSAVGPIANWKISSPGDHPEDVKARLKFWAQAVACTVRLCS